MKKRVIAMLLIASLVIGNCTLMVQAQDEENIKTQELSDEDQGQEELPNTEESVAGTEDENENGETDGLEFDEDAGETVEEGDEPQAEEVMPDNVEEELSDETEKTEEVTDEMPEEEVLGRRSIKINEGWTVNKNDASSQGWDFPLGGSSGTVNLPHSWEYTHPTMSYIPTMNAKTVTYEKELSVAEYQGRNLFIKFNGVSRNAELYIDGEKVGKHIGGYSAFVFDITDYVQNKEQVKIRVDVTNMDTASIPINVDYTQWAGIYRDVELVTTENQYIALEDYASSGLYIDSSLNGNNAEVSIRTKISNKAEESKALEIQTEILDENGNVVANERQAISVDGNSLKQEFAINTMIPNVHLWQGVSDPYLYTARVSLVDENDQMLDMEEERIGVRVFEIKNGKSYLNGKEYEIHGVGYHQDREGYGNAAGAAQKEEDINLMLEMGVNAVRTSHYPHDQYVYDLADEKGLLIYNEIPYYLLLSKAESYKNSITEQLKEMIRQGYNHPSIVMWGVNNEVKVSPQYASFGPEFDVDSETLIAFNKQVAELAQQEDTTRYIAQATIDSSTSAKDSAAWAQDGRIDFTGLNLYVGFKSSVSSAGDTGRKALINTLNKKIDSYKEIYGASSMLLTEYGAGANINQHIEVDENFSWNGNSDAAGQNHYEEYQCFVLEAYYDMIQKRNDVPMSFVWNMFDFSCYRNEGGVPRRNTKGLVCYDHQTEKDAFYFYKANWNKTDKFVHLTSKRFTERNKTTQNIKAYSNCESVDLYVNGKLIGAGKRQQEGVFVWENVTLANGSSIKVVANDSTGTYTDEVANIKVSNSKVGYSLSTSKAEWTKETVDGAENTVNGEIYAIRLNEKGNIGNCKILYRTYIEDKGWQEWKAQNEISGDINGSKKIKGVQVKLAGEDADQFDIYYTTKVNGKDWNDWAANGKTSGNFMNQTGLSAMKVIIQGKEDKAPGNIDNPETTDGATVLLSGAVNGKWQTGMTNGQLVGSVGKGTPLTGIRISTDSKGVSGKIEYDVHQANTGWLNGFEDGEMAGLTNGKALQAVRIRLNGELEEKYDVYYRAHVANLGWLGWAKNGQVAGTTGYGYNMEALEVVLVEKASKAPGTTIRPSENKLVSYQTHVQDIGWQGVKYQGEMSGTSGQSKRLEAIKINLKDAGYEGSVKYQTHIQNIGWQNWKTDGAISGTSGQSKRLEAIRIQLTGEMAKKYDIYYRVHAQNFGWLGWAKNGESAGTAGYAYRLEAIEIKVVEKGVSAPGSTANAYHERLVKYQVHVQNIGDQGYRYDGEMAGTSGESKRLEGLRITLPTMTSSSKVMYSAHIQDIGWQSWKQNGELAGTSGQSKRLEAVRIKLTGDAAEKYDIYYQVHVQNLGWLGWAKNGEKSGTAGYGYRLEGIRIQLVEKGGKAPGATTHTFEEK